MIRRRSTERWPTLHPHRHCSRRTEQAASSSSGRTANYMLGIAQPPRMSGDRRRGRCIRKPCREFRHGHRHPAMSRRSVAIHRAISHTHEPVAAALSASRHFAGPPRSLICILRVTGHGGGLGGRDVARDAGRTRSAQPASSASQQRLGVASYRPSSAARSAGTGTYRKALTSAPPVLPTGYRPVHDPGAATVSLKSCPRTSRRS